MTTRSTPRATKRVAAPKGKKPTRANTTAKLLVAMTGKASPAKAEGGNHRPAIVSDLGLAQLLAGHAGVEDQAIESYSRKGTSA